jgi:Xaa-Pro aminopeptidase
MSGAINETGERVVCGIPTSEFAERRSRLRELSAQRDLDGVLVVSRGANGPDWGGDVLYLTNHYSGFPQIPDVPPRWSGRGLSAFVMPKDEEGTLIVETPEWRPDLVVVDDVRLHLDLWAGIVSVLRDRGLASARVGIIGRESFPHIAAERIRADLPGVQLIWADDIIEQMRRIKSPAEVALMRESTRVGCLMINAFMEAVEPGVTEADCVIAGWSAGVREGAFPLDIPVVSGPNCDHFAWDRMPSWNKDRRLQAGEIIHPDNYGTVNGYFYDFSRTTVVGGKATPAQREILDTSIAVIEHIIEGMKPGVVCEDLYTRGATWLAEHGFDAPGAEDAKGVAFLGQTFPSFGHSLGLAWERPYLMPGEADPLRPNMVMAVEVQVGRPEVGTASFEHDVLITPDGAEILSSGARNVWWT